MKFLHQVGDSFPMNKTSLNETYEFEGKIVTVKKITGNYVYLDDGRGFPRKLFDMWARTTKYLDRQRTDLYHSLERIKYKKLTLELEEKMKKFTEKQSPLSYYPVNAMRYIIIQLFDESFSTSIGYRWLFANKPTSHSQLEEDYRKEHPKTNFEVLSGGFYCFRTANARKNGDGDCLNLFGKSDTYGLRNSDIIDAYDNLRAELNGVQILYEGGAIELLVDERTGENNLPF